MFAIRVKGTNMYFAGFTFIPLKNNWKPKFTTDGTIMTMNREDAQNNLKDLSNDQPELEIVGVSVEVVKA